MASQACGQTRAELNALLRECGFGRDADMFACYFLRKDRLDAAGRQETGIVCAACGLAVGEHDERDAEPVVVGTAMVVSEAKLPRSPPTESAATATIKAGHGAASSPRCMGPQAVPADGHEPRQSSGAERASDIIDAPPPGLARRTGYDEMWFDDSGLLWKLLLPLAIAGVVGGIVLILDNESDSGTHTGGVVMVFLSGFVLLVISILFVPWRVWHIYSLRFTHPTASPSSPNFHDERRVYINRPAARCCAVCCGNDDERFAMSVRSVRVALERYPTPEVARVILKVPDIGDKVVFDGKTPVPGDVQLAWATYLCPDDPRSAMC